MALIKYVEDSGFASTDEFMKKLVMPIVGATVFFFVFTLIYFMNQEDPGIMLAVPFGILVFGLAMIPVYIKMQVEKRRTNIQGNIHLFITYAGAISSLDIRRSKVFEEASKKEAYGEITQIMKKIYYLARDWELGYARICRKTASLQPSRIFGEFLDRLATALDFGEPLDVFFWNEQKAVMDEFEVEYKKSLESMNTLRDIYSSLIIAAAFVFACVVLIPFFIDAGITMLLVVSFLFLMLGDGMIILLVDSLIPKANICHSMPIKDQEYKLMLKALIFTLPVCFIVFVLLFAVQMFPLSLICVVSMTPLAIVGYYGKKREQEVIKRDNEFPGFMRSLGGSLSAKGGSVVTTLESLRVHEFGVLNESIEMLYRRLRVGTEKDVSWLYFSGESGSTLIYDFASIFVDITKLGGDPQKACEIISDNFSRLLHLRKLRLQMVNGMKAMFYGSLVAFGLTVNAGLEAVSIISGVITDITETLSDTPQATEVVSNLFASPEAFNISEIRDIIFVILLVQSVYTAYLVKSIEGGEKFAALIEVVIVAWGVFFIQILSSYISSVMV